MLGVLQILWLVENYPNTLKAIYAHSQIKEYEFPLAIKLFEFSALVLAQLKNKKMYYACNEEDSVFLACNKVYACLVIDYMKTYIHERGTIMQMDKINKLQKASLMKGVKKVCDPYMKLSDMESVALLTKGPVNSQDQKADMSIEKSLGQNNISQQALL